MSRFIVSMFVISALFTLSSTSVPAKTLAGGVKVGLNIANFSGDDAKIELMDEYGNILIEEDFSSKTGFFIGGFLTFTVSEMFAVQPELIYTMKGAKAEIEYGGEIDGMNVMMDYNTTIRLNYLEIPVLAKLTIPTAGPISPSLYFGPSLGIRLSAKGKTEGEIEVDGEVHTVDVEEDVKDETKSTDFGLVFGGGIGFDVGKGKIVADGRYTLGLTSVADVEGEDLDLKNGVFTFTFGYCFQSPV